MLREMIRLGRQAREIASMNRQQVEELQLRRFRELVQYVAEHSPYYADIIREHGIDPSSCSPEDFPVLSKQDVLDNFDRIITDRRINRQLVEEFLSQSDSPQDLLLNEYRVIHTSGSSGQVGYYLYSDGEWLKGLIHPTVAGQKRPRSRRTLPWRRPRMAYYAATDGHYAGVSVASTFMKGFNRLFIKVRLFEVNSPVQQVVSELNDFQPDMLAGYTTAVKVLADEQNAGRLQIKPVQILTSGESMSKADRMYLEQSFSCPAMNSYACSEHLTMGSAAADEQSMILFDENLIFEFHDDHSVVTNLFNYTLPLIRYRMADVLQPLPESEQSGPMLRVKPVIGRQEIMPVFRNEAGQQDFISPFTIIELFIPGVSRFQMQLLSDESFDFRLRLQPGQSALQNEQAVQAAREKLQDILQRKQMGNVSFTVSCVEDLPVNPVTGKFQLIVPAA